jgi:hypothetical protein
MNFVELRRREMNFAKRFLMIAGAGALAGILATAIAPKTAQALVAALVQVSNTPAAAVPVVHAPAASNVYFASCEGFFTGGFSSSCSMPPTAVDRTLVIEAASIISQTSGGADPSNAFIYTSGDGPFFSIPMQLQSPQNLIDNYTGQLQGRITIPANAGLGLTPNCEVVLGKNSTVGEFYCTINGYTVAAN